MILRLHSRRIAAHHTAHAPRSGRCTHIAEGFDFSGGAFHVSRPRNVDASVVFDFYSTPLDFASRQSSSLLATYQFKHLALHLGLQHRGFPAIMDEDPINNFFTPQEVEDPKILYTALGLTESATGEEIRKAYRKKALLLHPDKHGSKSDKEKQELGKEFQRVGFAYAVLSDEKKRKRSVSIHVCPLMSAVAMGNKGMH